VDDSWVTRKFVVKILEENGYVEIVSAGDGLEAIEKIKESIPDCILLDLLMPKLTGEDVLRHLQENKYNIPTIVLTADIQETTKQRCIALGAKELINKPINDKQLLKTLEQALQ